MPIFFKSSNTLACPTRQSRSNDLSKNSLYGVSLETELYAGGITWKWSARLVTSVVNRYLNAITISARPPLRCCFNLPVNQGLAKGIWAKRACMAVFTSEISPWYHVNVEMACAVWNMVMNVSSGRRETSSVSLSVVGVQCFRCSESSWYSKPQRR